MEAFLFRKNPTDRNPYILALAMIPGNGDWGSFLRVAPHKGISTFPLAKRPMVEFEVENIKRCHRLVWFKYRSWETLIIDEYKITEDVEWCKKLMGLSELKSFSDKFPKELI